MERGTERTLRRWLGRSPSACSFPRWNATCAGPSSWRWRAAEEVGFDSIWLGDHLLYRDDGRPERGPWDAWTTLAALAVSTERVRLGPLVACSAFHPPGMLARMAATIDEVSGGRFVLGIGAAGTRPSSTRSGSPSGSARRVSRRRSRSSVGCSAASVSPSRDVSRASRTPSC
ncbi:MAG: LLM class flavin-dependent oxidoreductase, partial [Actinobacteria bacterium]